MEVNIVNEERGSSMVEMIGVIGIVGILAMSVWGLINSAQSRYRLSQGVIQLQTLQKGINRFYASAGNYDKLRETDAIEELLENRIPPPGMKAGVGKLRNVFGTEVVIADVPYTNIDDYGKSSDSFAITFKSLRKNECAEMAGISWVQHDGANLVSITIGEKKFEWPTYDSVSSNLLPVTAAKAMEACANAPMDITWEFR